MSHHRATRTELGGLAVDVAPRLLGGLLATVVDGAEVVLRITEVEAYHGLGTGPVADPGSHARMGMTARNATMWGEPGHLYVYLSHGIHSCVNVVTGSAGSAGGVLLRAGEVVVGSDDARRRRQARTRDRADAVSCVPDIRERDLARGPGRFGQASGLRHPVDDGLDAVSAEPGPSGSVARLDLLDEPVREVASGPRVGVAGVAGTATFPWRFWILGDPSVSVFRPGRGAR
ncbi:DNA-3-methyladenine glycosylase [Microbacterium sp. GXF6406]